jgi:uracil-DNA glycosylase
MPQSQRIAYLKAMDIDVWVPKESLERDPMPAEPVPVAPERALMDWPAFRMEVAACTRCELHRTRTQTVFGVGSANADWMLIGEAPGADEDAQGEPFVGRAGKLLNNMLKAIGLERETVFIANILKCRPPKNRDPKPEEAAACGPYLNRQIEWIKPKIIVGLGRVAAQKLLSTEAPIGRLRGSVHRYENVPLVVTYHPAYLLRSPSEKRKAWEDLKLAMRVYKEQADLGGDTVHSYRLNP